MKPKLSICICVFNKKSFTINCIKDLLHLKDVEIIIVDNASSDGTKEELENRKDIIYYRSEKNLGFAGGSNIAYNLSTSDNIMFLNNDISVRSNKEDWVNIIIENCHRGLVGPTMGQLDKNLNFIKESNSYLNGISYMSGWCLSSSRGNWEKLHIPRKTKNIFKWQIFSEEYFAYFEDTSLSLKARQIKIPFIIIDVPVVHFKKQTSCQLNTGSLYSNSRNIFLKNWGTKIKKLKFD